MTAPLGRDADRDASESALPCPGARPSDALRDEVVRALRGEQKTLPPKLFYDAVGAELFERICTLPEYYLTRAELEILRARAPEIARLAGPRAALVEYGSGAGVKVRLLLDALEAPAAYVPIDIAGAQLSRVAADIASEYPHVEVRPLCADYTAPLALPPLAHAARRVAFFPGSTIGNFHPAEAALFLRRIRRTVSDGGALVLGVDRVKDPRVLEAAYDDAQGVTAAFNVNMLRRLNTLFDGDFQLDAFAHRALFNARASRIEMHLVSLVPQTVTLAGERFTFDAGETIWTESSYKYDRERLRELAEAAGFVIDHLWTDRDERFWVTYLRAI